MANLAPHLKNRYAITTVLFIVLFLFSISLFSKRALEPSLLPYKDFSSLIKSHIAAEAAIPEPLPDPEVADSSSQELVASILQTDKLAPALSTESTDSIDDQVISEEEKDTVPEKVPVAYNGGELAMEKNKMCDLYTGTWVRDEEYPIYKPGSCPYVDEAFDCQSNGRRDSDYLRWRWKPDGCDLPRYGACYVSCS